MKISNLLSIINVPYNAQHALVIIIVWVETILKLAVANLLRGFRGKAYPVNFYELCITLQLI